MWCDQLLENVFVSPREALVWLCKWRESTRLSLSHLALRYRESLRRGRIRNLPVSTSSALFLVAITMKNLRVRRGKGKPGEAHGPRQWDRRAEDSNLLLFCGDERGERERGRARAENRGKKRSHVWWWRSGDNFTTFIPPHRFAFQLFN